MSDLDTRLSQISTQWGEVWAAHSPDQRTQVAQARWELLRRYGGAISRSLTGTTRDPDLACELAQEFAVTFLDGGLSGATPDKGRFRDYLKGVLRNLARSYHRKAVRRSVAAGGDAGHPEPAVEPDFDAELDRSFHTCWRDELLANTWAGLERLERQIGQPYQTLLRLRADQPDLSSD